MFAKDTNSFTYVLLITCFPKNNIESIANGAALDLRTIWNSNRKSDKCSPEYQNYLISINYKPGKLKKQFFDYTI